MRDYANQGHSNPTHVIKLLQTFIDNSANEVTVGELKNKLSNWDHENPGKIDLDSTFTKLDEMYKGDLGYFTVTMDSDDCLDCGYHGIIDNTCPKCGCSDENKFVRVRRITGYLSGAPRKSLYSSWNSGKIAELKYRKNI